jgi:Asp-tRNA(Asn)/Glu-tRNA(Gln) amidotransferase A subunit family amidase
VARLFCTMAGWDPRAPLSLDAPLPDPGAADPIACEPGKRIGWLGSIWPDLPLEPGIAQLCESALRKLQAAGYEVEPARWTSRATSTGTPGCACARCSRRAACAASTPTRARER